MESDRVIGMKALLAFAAFILSVGAQEIPLQKLRLLPLGDPPPFQQAVRDGVRYELDAPEGSLPPAKVILEDMVPAPSTPIHPLRLTLGQATPDLTAPLAKQTLGLQKDHGGTWAKVRPHASGSSLILLWRSGGTWNEVGHLALDDSQAVHKDHAVHFTNVTAVKMGVILGEEKLLLEPKATFTRIIPRATACRIVYLLSGNQTKTCFQSELTGSAGSHQRVIVYPTNSATSRNPAKVLLMTEAHAIREPVTVDLR